MTVAVVLAAVAIKRRVGIIIMLRVVRWIHYDSTKFRKQLILQFTKMFIGSYSLNNIFVVSLKYWYLKMRKIDIHLLILHNG